MKHPYKRFLPSIIALFCLFAAQAQSDIYESYIILNSNGAGNTYYDLNASTVNPDFDGTDLGTFTTTNSLILNGAQNKTYKCGTHNIMNGFIDYRIYPAASTPGVFNPSEILFNADDGTSNFCGNTSTDQTWESMGANINVLNGLASGDYVLEVYVRADVDTNSDNITDFTLFNSNSSTNYSATFRVDNAPIAVCQNLTIQLAATGNATITPASIDNGSSDDFDTPMLSIDINSFDCSDIGNLVTVTLTAEDSLGQTDSCLAIISVEDNINPITPTLAPVTLDCNGTLIAPTTTDNCAGTITGTTTDTLAFVEGGSTTITWTFDDGNGNAIIANQIYNYDDTTNPTIPTLSPVTVDFNGTLIAPTTTDDCAGTINGTTTDTLAFVEGGSTTITWTFDDGNGNAITANQVYNYDDTTNPVTPTLTPITVDCNGTLIAPITTDDCAGIITGTTTDTLAFVEGGSSTITWTFDDGNGNAITTNQVYNYDDTTNPVTPTLTPITVDCNGTLIAPTTTDDCAGIITGTTTDTLAFVEGGSTTITWTFDDGNGNAITANQIYNYDDITNPVAICQNITVQLDNTGSVTIIPTDLDNGSTDDCGTLTYSLSQTTFTCSDIGPNNVTFTVNDGNGQTDSCVAVVTVEDNINPIALCQDITVQLDASGNASILPSDIDNGSTDNCGISSISLGQTTFNCSNIGANTVTLFVRDTSNNLSTCNATVTITDPAENSTVSITVNDNPICADEMPIFTATPSNAGTTQFYEWFINGFSEGTTSVPTFSPIVNPTSDYTIFARMTTNISACEPVESNTLCIVVNPLPSVNVTSESICLEDFSQSASPSSGGTWTSSDTSIATIDNNGTITPVSGGDVTFTFIDAITSCSNSTNTVTIEDLPIISDLPLNNRICIGDIYTLSPTTGGTWTSSNTSVATISSSGTVTGLIPGYVTFTFTSTATGCTSITPAINILRTPVIDSVTASDNIVCAGNPTVLSANVTNILSSTEVIVNYDFNTGSNYNELIDISGTPNIDSNFYSASGSDNIPFNTRWGALGGPFVYNSPRGNAILQVDDYNDGGSYGGTDDSGIWHLDVSGSDLLNYKNIRIGFQYMRTSKWGEFKNIEVDYRVGNSGPWTTTIVPVPNYNSFYATWRTANIALPISFNNSSLIQFRLRVDDGSTLNTAFGGIFDFAEPGIAIDNLQVQGTLGDSFDYEWSSNTGANSGLPISATIPSAINNQITVNPEVTTEYTVTVRNVNGCSATETITINVNPVPELTIFADYCPTDDPTTPEDESNMVQLIASSDIPVDSWEWNTGSTTNSIYVDTAGLYQVAATTSNGCSSGTSIEVARELISNGDFSFGNTGFNSDYTYHPDIAGNNELIDDSIDTNNPPAFVNGYSITTDGNNVNPNFFGQDHTDGTGNFMAVNGHGSQYVVWSQSVNVELGEAYNFAAWARSLNASGPFAQLRFRINGVQLGSQLNLGGYPTNDWGRFFGTWTSTVDGPVLVEIINNQDTFNGNDFALDDITFATLSTFIELTSGIGSDNQTFCQNSPITEITYDIGGGLTGPSISGLPPGLTTSFDGLEFSISGTPTQAGTYNYTIDANASCGNKTASGTIIIEAAPLVTINTLSSTVCASDGSINLSATLGGSATSGSWSLSGTPITTTVTGNDATATYNITTPGLFTFTFTSNDPVGICDAVTETIDIQITPYIQADANPLAIDYTILDCSARTVSLNANNVSGQWSATPNTGFFSNPNAYNSDFTGESGTSYTLTWTATNTSPCVDSTDALVINIPDCGTNLIFDGTDDYINLGDNYNLNGAFSIEGWINANNIVNTGTIISKRNGNLLNTGYDLSVINSRLYFRYNNSQIISTQTMISNKWYHVAVTFDGTDYNLYIDGFVVRSATSGSSPIVNTNNALIGALDQSGTSPLNYFDGKIDETRIWDTSLSLTQIREMMNQEIKSNGSNVIGEIVPINISGNLQWANLIGYYQMNTGAQANVSAGIVSDISTVSPTIGNLNGMTNNQVENAPIPYISISDNNWDNTITWSTDGSQQIPNSTVNNIVPNSAQTWNIVVTQHNITNNRTTELASLLVNTDKLSITNDEALTLNNCLKIDGNLDLEGQSQLLQPMGSIVDNSGSGYLERDQQGTSNLYNYNYFTSPVSIDGVNYSIDAVLHDGTTPSNPLDLNWTNSYDANPATSPITLSSRWLYLYENYPENSFADWNAINENSNIPIGLGFSMKGSGAASLDQNYIFIGKPNNGTITSPVSGGYQALVGNPYPSALDANAFILDNSGVLLDGTLYFWEHAPANNTHNTAQYQGGYAARNLTTGVPAVSPPEINGSGNANKIPGRYVPVAQGFFVTGNASGGNITFRNSQRAFVKEQGANSVFLRGTNTSETAASQQGLENDKFIRLNFITPENAVRHLVVGFMDSQYATDGIDYGYDGLNQDYFPNDMSFNIEGEKFVIQGVGAFDEDKIFPLDIVLGNGGNIEIGLEALKNFDETIDVYIFDALDGSYTRINDINYQKHLETGNYSNRFSMVFRESNALSTVKDELDLVLINYLQSTNEIYVNLPVAIQIERMELINILGQTVKTWTDAQLPKTSTFKLPVDKISEGGYILKVKTDKGDISKKLIVKY